MKVTDEVVIVFGLKFVPMDDFDWDTFAGAEEGTLICYVGETVLLYDPAAQTITESLPDGSGERIWKSEGIVR